MPQTRQADFGALLNTQAKTPGALEPQFKCNWSSTAKSIASILFVGYSSSAAAQEPSFSGFRGLVACGLVEKSAVPVLGSAEMGMSGTATSCCTMWSRSRAAE